MGEEDTAKEIIFMGDHSLFKIYGDHSFQNKN